MKESEKHWSQKKEAVSSYKGLHFLLVLSKFVPHVVIKLIVMPVSLFYFFFSQPGKTHSKEFLNRVATITGKKETSVLKHFASFALNLVEKMQSWSGKFSFKKICFQQDDVGELVEQLEKKQGAMLICSHLGNAELLRALAELDRTGISHRVPTISIVDFSVSPHFFRMIEEVNPESMHHIISAKDIGPDTAIVLQQHLEDGGLVVIAGDRTSGTTIDSYLTIPFLGEVAPFATGPFFLALILGVPCYAVFGLRDKAISFFPKYNMHVRKLELPQNKSRKERKQAIENLARQFSKELEYHCLKNPYQWYNFYNFWAKPNLGEENE